MGARSDPPEFPPATSDPARWAAYRRHVIDRNRRQRRRQRLVVCAAVLVGTLVPLSALGWGVYRAVKPTLWPPPRVVLTSDSPDGRYRCVFTEFPPQWGRESPYRYAGTVVDLSAGQPLPGRPLEVSNDSAALHPLNSNWEAAGVTVHETDVGRSRWACDVAGGGQVWVQRPLD